MDAIDAALEGAGVLMGIGSGGCLEALLLTGISAGSSFGLDLDRVCVRSVGACIAGGSTILDLERCARIGGGGGGGGWPELEEALTISGGFLSFCANIAAICSRLSPIWDAIFSRFVFLIIACSSAAIKAGLSYGTGV